MPAGLELVRAADATELADHRDGARAREGLRVDFALEVVPSATNVYEPGLEVDGDTRRERGRRNSQSEQRDEADHDP